MPADSGLYWPRALLLSGKSDKAEAVWSKCNNLNDDVHLLRIADLRRNKKEDEARLIARKLADKWLIPSEAPPANSPWWIGRSPKSLEKMLDAESGWVSKEFPPKNPPVFQGSGLSGRPDEGGMSLRFDLEQVPLPASKLIPRLRRKVEAAAPNDRWRAVGKTGTRPAGCTTI